MCWNTNPYLQCPLLHRLPAQDHRLNARETPRTFFWPMHLLAARNVRVHACQFGHADHRYPLESAGRAKLGKHRVSGFGRLRYYNLLVPSRDRVSRVPEYW